MVFSGKWSKKYVRHMSLRVKRLLILKGHPVANFVAFAVLRGSTGIRMTSGALFVLGTHLISGTISSAFVSPLDRTNLTVIMQSQV
jgi:hypothetical protein